MQKVVTGRAAGGGQQEIQRRILESIEPGNAGVQQDGFQKERLSFTKGRGHMAGQKHTGEDPEARLRRQRREKELERQRRLHRQCILLGIVAFGLLVALLLQRAGDGSRPSYGADVKGRIMTASDADGKKGESRDGSGFLDEGNLLMLVNKDHAVPEDYVVEEHWLQNGRVSVSEEMYDALRDMLTAGSEDGREFVVASGYRSAEYQRQLLEEDIERDMRELGMTWQEAYDRESLETMPAGYSEHETGLAVDLVALDYQVLDGQQEYTEENRWLRENCQEYGFILRYPKDKEEVTGIRYEPWHFRYVGVEAAKEIKERGITLEEYLGE